MVFHHKKVVLFVTWAMLFLTLSYAIAYTLISYDTLVNWYYNITPHFYKNDIWTSDFFTHRTKVFGHLYSWSLVFMSIFILLVELRTKRNDISTIELKKPLIAVDSILVFSLTMVVWWLWQMKAAYATDEVFSAIHFASKPLFLTISYYPLPNNHIFFNAINHWFIYFTDDLVFTGRLIAGFAIAWMMKDIYIFTNNLLKNKLIRIAIILLLLTIFPIFGFATQARGYGLHLLLSWVSFVNIYQYNQNHQKKYLTYFGFVAALGLWTIPSFLYFWIGMSLPNYIKMVMNRKLDISFILTSVKIVWLTLILYLPAVTFSGWRALFANKYVATGQEGYTEFIYNFFSGSYFQGLFNEWFATGSFTWIGLSILSLPFIIWKLDRKNIFSQWIWYLVSTFFSLIIMIIVMKKYPFYRNLISHCMMFWVVLLILLGIYVQSIKKQFTYIMLGTMVMVASYFTYTNFRVFPFQLYYYDVNTLSNTMYDHDLSAYTALKVHIEDESFYWHTPIRKVTDQIILGGVIDPSADILIIESGRTSKIDTLQWIKLEMVGDTEFWKKVK